jgi:hypothetical protein
LISFSKLTFAFIAIKLLALIIATGALPGWQTGTQ